MPPRGVTSDHLRDIFRLLWSHTDGYAKRRWAIALLLLISASVFGALAPLALKLAVDGFASGDSSRAYITPGLFIGAYVLGQWLSRCSGQLRWAMHGPARRRLQRRVSKQLFGHVMSLPLQFHANRHTGALSHTLAQGVLGCEVVLDHTMFSILPVLVEFSIISVVLIQLDQPIALNVLAAASVLYAIAFGLGMRRINCHSRTVSASEIDSSAVLTDSFLNYEIVKYFNAEVFLQDGYDRALAKAECHSVQLFRSMASSGVLGATVFALSLGVSVGFASHQVIQGTMTIGDFVLVNAYMLQLILPLEMLGLALLNVSRGLGFAAKMLDLLREQPERQTASRMAARSIRGDLRFESVTLSYRPGRIVLDRVSFTVAPGSTLAIVGSSGAGKSSLVRLLMRLYEPDAGRILLDNVPISELRLSALRDAIAVVPQDTILFNDTIAFNIGFGRPGSTIRDIQRAAMIAHLHEFVVSLPDGYDTVVGERGIKLSGGEKQRVAIARAALKRPSVYVFDEATASLDTQIERVILRDLIEVSCGCTTLMIAHRLSTIIGADKIIVLEDGRVAEQGTHHSLIDLGGRYTAMWRAQQCSSPTQREAALLHFLRQ